MKNTAMNEFTGDQLSSGHVSDAYRDGYTAIYGDKEKQRYDRYVAWANKNNTPYCDFESFQKERGKEPRWMKHEWDEDNE